MYIAPRVIEVQIPGIQGPPGTGGSGDKTYRHVQGVASATWVVVHGLNKYPSVVVVSSANEIVEGGITYTDVNTVTLTFSGAFSGEAHFN